MTNHGGRRPGAGRPADVGQPRTEMLRIRVSEGELAEITAAVPADETLSKWVREAVLQHARRTK